jgi:hypothetical protein
LGVDHDRGRPLVRLTKQLQHIPLRFFRELTNDTAQANVDTIDQKLPRSAQTALWRDERRGMGAREKAQQDASDGKKRTHWGGASDDDSEASKGETKEAEISCLVNVNRPKLLGLGGV